MIHVRVPEDFDPAKIAASGQCFRVQQAGEGWQFITGQHLLRLQPYTAHRWQADCTRCTWQRIWSPYFDFGRDYAAIRAAIPPQDAYLCAAAQYGKGVRVLRQDAWEMLITFIISQRKSIPAIKKCVEALCTAFGAQLAPGVYAFPTPQALRRAGVDELAKCGLGYRTPYVQAAAQSVAGKTLDLKALANLPDEELLAALMQCYGVGVKVANCVALFAYGRVACAPVDVWIERVIATYYAGRNPFPQYGNAGILQQYMFYHALGHKAETRR